MRKGFIIKIPSATIPGILFICLLFSVNSFAQQKQRKTRILFIFDCSGSMWEKMAGSGASKIDVAKTILIKIVDSLNKQSNIEMALRCFGNHSKSQVDC